jgi:hypothetical protein
MTSPALGNRTTGDQKPSVAAHVAGPWIVDYGGNQVVTKDAAALVCGMYRSTRNLQTAATARLIAAAPDML